jgi:hypothetical protein
MRSYFESNVEIQCAAFRMHMHDRACFAGSARHGWLPSLPPVAAPRKPLPWLEARVSCRLRIAWELRLIDPVSSPYWVGDLEDRECACRLSQGDAGPFNLLSNLASNEVLRIVRSGGSERR